MADGEMCVFCGEDTEDHVNPFGALASAIYACKSHTNREVLHAWCEQRLQDVGGQSALSRAIKRLPPADLSGGISPSREGG